MSVNGCRFFVIVGLPEVCLLYYAILVTLECIKTKAASLIFVAAIKLDEKSLIRVSVQKHSISETGFLLSHSTVKREREKGPYRTRNRRNDERIYEKRR